MGYQESSRTIPGVVKLLERRGVIDPQIQNQDALRDLLNSTDPETVRLLQSIMIEFRELTSLLPIYCRQGFRIPADMHNTRLLSQLVQSSPGHFPSMYSMEVGSRGNLYTDYLRQTIQAAERMNNFMLRGQADKPKPRLKYHFRTEDPAALFTGTLFHMYEEMVRVDPRYSGHMRMDRVVCALIEVLYDRPGNALLTNLVGAPEKLNWIRGYEGFTPEFRHRVLGEPLPTSSEDAS
jgi:hypothetical protein